METMSRGTPTPRAGTLAAVASPMQAPLRIASAAAAALDTSRIEHAAHGDGQLGDRLPVVDVQADAGLDARQRRERRVANHERDTHALLVRTLLRLPAMPAPRVAVVGRVDDHRIGVLTGVAERLDERADR